MGVLAEWYTVFRSFVCTFFTSQWKFVMETTINALRFHRYEDTADSLPGKVDTN